MSRFVAILPDAPLRQRLSTLDPGPGLRRVAPEKLHLTLRFLGEEAPPPGLAEIAAATPAFQLTVQGLGAFPDLARTRVLWVGVAPNQPLQRLAQAIHSLPGPVTQPFHPHWTLARARQPADLREMPCPMDPYLLTVDCFFLMESKNGRYEPVLEFKLRQ